MKPLLALLFTATLTSAVFAQAAAPADPNGWVKEIATANKLLAAGYVDAAQKDFESIIQRYAANAAGIDRAWLGLAKIHMARYDFDQAKVSLEEVLRRNSDAESLNGAKSTYRQLKQEADGKAQQAQKALQFLEQQYAYTSWLNPFAKLFTYLDLKKARAAAEAATAAANTYDPHFFIDDVAASAIRSDATLTGSDFQPAGLDTPAITAASATAAPGVSVHTPAPGASASGTTTAASAIATTGALTAPAADASPSVAAPGVVATLPIATTSPAPLPSPAAASLVVTPSPAPAASAAASPAPAPIVISASPAPTPSASAASSTRPSETAAAEPDLMSLQRSYQESYRKLQEALTMGNQSRIVALNAEYQKALEAYRNAAAAGRR